LACPGCVRDVNVNDETALHIAVMNDRYEELHIAVMNDRYEELEVLCVM